VQISGSLADSKQAGQYRSTSADVTSGRGGATRNCDQKIPRSAVNRRMGTDAVECRQPEAISVAPILVFACGGDFDPQKPWPAKRLTLGTLAPVQKTQEYLNWELVS